MRRKGKISMVVAVAWLALVMGCQPMTPRDFEETAAGAYDLETRYDLQALSGSMSQYAGAWAEPDLAIRDAIFSEIRSSYGASVADLAVDLYANQLARQIHDYIASLPVAWLLDLRQMLAQIDAQMASVDLQSSLLLVEQGGVGQYQATKIWNGITLFRDPDCKKSGQILCDEVGFDLQSMVDAEYPLEVISATYDVQESGRDALEMSSHELKFNYGRLGLYLLTNLVLPDEPGDGLALRDVVLAAINCRGLAGRLAGDDGVYGWEVGGVNVGLGINELIGSCEDGVFAVVNDFVDQFHIPLSMSLQGTAQMFDDDADGRTDRLAGGDLSGRVQASLLGGRATKEGDVSARFTGFRVGEAPTPGDDDVEVMGEVPGAEAEEEP